MSVWNEAVGDEKVVWSDGIWDMGNGVLGRVSAMWM